MTTRIWTKPETQSTIKQLRQAGYNVGKVSGMYKVLHDNGDVWNDDDGVALFTAMPGNGSYLVKFSPELMS